MEGGGCGEERMKGGRVWRREDGGGGCGKERMKGEGVEKRPYVAPYMDTSWWLHA